MKFILSSIFIILSSVVIFSQNLTGFIEYNLKIVSDTVHGIDQEQKNTLYFDINENKSLWVTRRKEKNIKETKQDTKFSYGKNGGIAYIKQSPKAFDSIGVLVFKSYKTKELIGRDYISNKPFIIQNDYPKIVWQILNETKIIAGLECQKANGDYHGRNYTAWFTNKIPIPDGPWKLCGLPGLILEAYDEKVHIKFELVNLEFPKNIDEKLIAPDNGEEINFKNYHKQYEISVDDAIKRALGIAGDLNNVRINNFVRATTIERNIED